MAKPNATSDQPFSLTFRVGLFLLLAAFVVFMVVDIWACKTEYGRDPWTGDLIQREVGYFTGWGTTQWGRPIRRVLPPTVTEERNRRGEQ